MLGVAGRKQPTCMVGQKLRVANVEQSNGGVTEDQQVATELREGLVGSPLQSVIDVITPSHGKPSRHGRVGWVSRNVHMDLAAPQPELTLRVATIRGKPRVAEAVQHVLEQDGKPGVVQPVTKEPSVGCKGCVGVVIHLSKTWEKRINISSIKQRQQTKTPN
jgi:hypothetical protein